LDVSVQGRGVVVHLDPDLPGIHFRLAPECFLDLGLNRAGASRWRGSDVVGDADRAADVADHALDLAALILVVRLTQPRCTLAWILPAGTWVFGARMCAKSCAMSASSLDSPDSCTVISSATAVTP
jgi:hypothetical protein